MVQRDNHIARLLIRLAEIMAEEAVVLRINVRGV
jgi:hypothetical protein